MPTISQLPVASTLGASDLMVSVQNGVTSQITGSIVATFVIGQLSLGTAAHVNVPIVPLNGGTGVSSPTAHTLPVAEGASNYNFVGPLTNGQLLIGSTGGDPVAANLVAGSNIGITNSSGSITISASGFAGFSWNVVTSSSQLMLTNNGYIANKSTLVTLTLPTTSAVGDELDIVGMGSGGWTIAQNSGQSIVFGTSTTTTGTGGSLSSTHTADSLYMICTVANTTWTVGSGPIGNLTVI
jgi:hypothetical protein